ncbi:MAG TPA: glycosyltransferase family 39 protein [Patescibacteria group bacterium]
MKKNILLLVILFIAFFLRFFQLGAIPASLTWDEVAWGYNAYSLGINGTDEFGRFLPHDYLESFGDYKPPMYAYLDVVPIKTFGLNEFATRFPSAFFGLLTVLVTYFLVKRLFYKSENAKLYGLATSLILAVSPWHIMLSRAAFEANVANFFVVCGVWLFLAAVQDRPWYLILSAASFVASMYTFNSARVVAPLLVIILGIIFLKRLLQHKKSLILAIVVGILFILPTFKFLLSPQAGLRFQEVNIFSDVSLVTTSNQEIKNDNNAWWSKIIHNRRLVYTAEYLHHYFDNLNPAFLFIKGDGNPKFSTQDVGEMYLWDLPFFVIGLVLLFKRKEGKWWVIPIWLLLGIIPAAFARETPHALRIENSLPTFQIVIAYGFVLTILYFKKYRKLITVTLLLLLFLNVLYFLHGYFANYTREYAGEWQYGYKDSLTYLKSVENNYSRIYFTDELGRPYIYYLFYNKISPSEFRKNSDINRDVFGFVHVNSVGKYYFAKDLPNKEGKSLYVNIPSMVPSNAHIQKKFYLPNGSEVLIAYTL